MVHLHTTAELERYSETRRLIDATCGVLQCERGDLLRMLGGLMASLEMMRTARDGRAVSEAEIAALPKRYRKPFKQRRE